MKNFLLNLHKRTVIRVISFTLAAFIVAIGFAIAGYQTAVNYQYQLEYSYQRAMDDLSNYISNIDLTLNKGLYTGSNESFDQVASQLWKEAGYAKSCLGQLPISQLNLDNTQRYLSQVGNFAMSLSKKAANGENITNEERDILNQLSGYADQISNQILQIQEQVNTGVIKIGETAAINNKDNDAQEALGLTDGFNEIESSFTDYPSLIYDGPFSDHIMQREPQLLKGQNEISQEEAFKIASEFSGIDKAQLQLSSIEEGHMPSYIFDGQGVTISVTKAGGYVSYLLNSQYPTDILLSQEECINIAKEFLSKHGMDSVKESYYFSDNGICTINFAYTNNDIVFYTDLIKVGVSMQDGKILSFDANGYIMNHKDRQLDSPKISLQDAQSKLSPYLNVTKSGLCVIPTDGLQELFCYEFLCKGQNNQDVLVYINCENGNEERILILMYSDNGILAM